MSAAALLGGFIERHIAGVWRHLGAIRHNASAL